MKIFGFVVPWSGATTFENDPIETAPEIPPLELTSPDMVEFELQFEEAFPDPAAPEHISAGRTFQWPALAQFVTDRANTNIDQYIRSYGGNPDSSDARSVKGIVAISRQEQQTAWSSMISLLQLYLYSFARRTNQNLDTLWAVAVNTLDALPVWKDLAVREANIHTDDVARVLLTALADVEARQRDERAWAIAVEHQWVHDHWIVPLRERDTAETVARRDAITHVTQVDIPTQVDTKLAPVVAAVATIPAITTAVSALQKESDECVKPMCQTMGPKTDLGKLFKALNAAADIALFVELASLDKDGLEGVLRRVASWAGKAVDAFDTTFVAGGGKIRDVLSGIGIG